MPESANGLYQSNSMISQFMPNNGVTAKAQMAFQEYLSNTAHQREMADLQAAGLNPWFASNSGASTPTGGQDSGDVISLLNGSNRNSGHSRMAEEGEGFLYNLFTAFGMKKTQAKGLSESLNQLGLTDEKVLALGLGIIDRLSAKVDDEGSVVAAVPKLVGKVQTVNDLSGYWNLGTSGWSNEVRRLAR